MALDVRQQQAAADGSGSPEAATSVPQQVVASAACAEKV
jgi:hypothetical protein